MPSINTLPSEILLSIAKLTSSDYLRADVNRLLFCRPWYQVAQCVALEDITLSLQSIQRFVAAPKETHSLVQRNVKRVSIRLRNFDTHKFVLVNHPSEIEAASPALDHNRTVPRSGSSIHGRRALLEGLQICGSLISLASYLPDMTVLDTFRLDIAFKLPWLFEETPAWEDELFTKAMETSILSLPSTIKSLTIDNSSDGFTSDFLAADTHSICAAVLSVNRFPFLRHLRIRMLYICPQIFPMEGHLQRPHNIQTIVINLTHPIDPTMKRAYTTHSCAEDVPSLQPLSTSMIEAAKSAVARKALPAVRELKVIHERNEMFYSYDVLTGIELDLEPGKPWDDLDWIDEDVGKEPSQGSSPVSVDN